MYLLPKPKKVSAGCRGGVAEKPFERGGYALEIGNNCNADFELLAVANNYKAVIELLQSLSSPLAHLLWVKIHADKMDLKGMHDAVEEDEED